MELVTLSLRVSFPTASSHLVMLRSFKLVAPLHYPKCAAAKGSRGRKYRMRTGLLHYVPIIFTQFVPRPSSRKEL